ncbi:hypothetical protein HY632_00080 [Candidatus Uhrbacteria bacterium]|nr:hypothetical protein [Candidatus Uhrbacteria bacterium]
MTRGTKLIRVLVGADGTLTVTESEGKGPEAADAHGLVFALTATLPEEQSDAMRGMTATAIDTLMHRLRAICKCPSGYPRPGTVVVVRGAAVAGAAFARGDVAAFAAVPTAVGCFARAVDGRIVLDVLTDLGCSEATMPDTVLLQEVPGHAGVLGLTRYLAEQNALSSAMFRAIAAVMENESRGAFARTIEAIAVRRGTAALADAAWETIGDPGLVDACVRATEWEDSHMLEAAVRRCTNAPLLAQRLGEPTNGSGVVPADVRSVIFHRLVALQAFETIRAFLCTVSDSWLSSVEKKSAHSAWIPTVLNGIRDQHELMAAVALDDRTALSVRSTMTRWLRNPDTIEQVLTKHGATFGDYSMKELRNRVEELRKRQGVVAES